MLRVRDETPDPGPDLRALPGAAAEVRPTPFDLQWTETMRGTPPT